MMDNLSPLKTISLIFQTKICHILDVFIKLESAKQTLVSLKGGNGTNMKEFKNLCSQVDGKIVFKGKQLDVGRYAFRRQQNLDEIWTGNTVPAP